MIYINIEKKIKIYSIKTKKYYRIFFRLLLISFLYIILIIIKKKKVNGDIKKEDEKHLIAENKSENNYNLNNQCYLSLYNYDINIMHFIITRFLIDFYHDNGFPKKLENEDYVSNGIRVLKKYLIPSLENQSCKNFSWILMIGNKSNITHIKSLLNFNHSFEVIVLYEKELKYYVRKISKGFKVLITTRIDYDDRIYYDAVNDVRKSINIEKPMVLYGYNRGLIYYELNDKYYEHNANFTNGPMSIFISLIEILDKVNDTYTIYDLGDHAKIRQKLLEKYKSYGVNKINYDPSIFDSGDPKYIWVRQKYSGYKYSVINQKEKELKLANFNFSAFFGK